jgi:DNA processing protein
VSPEAAAATAPPVSGPIRPGEWPSGFAAGDPDRSALVVLTHLEGLTPRALHELAWREGSAAACLRAVLRGAAGSPSDREAAGRVDVGRVGEALAACGARIAVPDDEEYPDRLLDLPDPPACLYVRGRPPPGAGGRSDPAVAVVGARACSPYGREVAEGIGGGLAAAGVSVVSGAAIGIDGAAHRGALRVGGPTVAVLGSGIDTAYPRQHRGLIDRIAQAGSVLSEYPPGVRPEPRRFPARNRLVAALAGAVVVVEGAPGSGSLITAEFAEDLHRDVLAVPGPVTSPLSQAPNELIRDGGTLVRGPDDVLAWLDMWRPGPGTGIQPAADQDLTDEQRLVLEAVAGEPVTVDAVATRTGLGTSVALSALMALELRGILRSVGGRYERTASAPG